MCGCCCTLRREDGRENGDGEGVEEDGGGVNRSSSLRRRVIAVIVDVDVDVDWDGDEVEEGVVVAAALCRLTQRDGIVVVFVLRLRRDMACHRGTVASRRWVVVVRISEDEESTHWQVLLRSDYPGLLSQSDTFPRVHTLPFIRLLEVRLPGLIPND